MRKRVINYLNYLEEMTSKELSEAEKKEFLESFMKQLDFFQHERLIHLLVTITFAIIAVLTFGFLCITPNIPFCLFLCLLLVLLFFYVRHYFFLERSVQKMYVYYDKLVEPQIYTDTIIEPTRKRS